MPIKHYFTYFVFILNIIRSKVNFGKLGDMMNNSNDMIGKRFGKLVVLSPIQPNKFARWICICDCGNTTIVTKGNLLYHHTESCGCLRKQPLCKEHTKNCILGTNITKIQSTAPYKNNKTGHRGVLYRKDIKNTQSAFDCDCVESSCI